MLASLRALVQYSRLSFLPLQPSLVPRSHQIQVVVAADLLRYEHAAIFQYSEDFFAFKISM
jgi:hypothetical protein